MQYRGWPGYACQRVCDDDLPASRQERLLCGRQLGTVITARKQVAVVSSVITMDACPSRACTTFGGNSDDRRPGEN